jgi:membrane-associated PAP2 superfamily phosphatase
MRSADILSTDSARSPQLSGTTGAGRLDRTALWAVGLLLAALILFETTGVDLWIQDAFYNRASGEWLVDANARWPRVFFYNGPKYLIIAFGLGCMVLAAGPAAWRQRFGVPLNGRADLWIVVLTLAAVPGLIGWSKATTNVFCPSEIERYGGDVPYVRVLEHYPEGKRPARRGRCFPAGHASGGFALLSLAGLARTSRGRRLGVAAGLALGVWMGAYQMLKGAHYLSHTVITALVAWLIFLLWRRLLRRTSAPAFA